MDRSGDVHGGRVPAALGLLMLAVTLVACGGLRTAATATAPSATSLAGNFAGAVPGTDAFLAVVVDKSDHALAYVCDSKQTADWFRGAVAPDGALDLTAPDGAHLTGKVAPGSVAGTLTLAGKSLPFTASPTEGDAGLYRATETINGTAYVGGWIVLPDGEQRGSVRGGNDIIAILIGDRPQAGPGGGPHITDGTSNTVVNVPNVGAVTASHVNGLIDEGGVAT